MRASHHPTTDLYFWNSCRPWVQMWRRRAPIRHFGANSFILDRTLLLLRRDEPHIMEAAATWPGRLIYLIDDDFDTAAQTPSLPDGYRRRLTQFAGTHYDKLIHRADVVVASSDILAQRLANDRRVHGEVVRLDPYWGLPPADQHHFRRASSRLEMVHLGSASHSGGLDAIEPAILKLIADIPHLRFSYVSPRGLHPALERHARARRIHPMRWSRYRRWLARCRFHLALYPLEDTGFDRARSINKLLEHTIVGATGVYPAGWPAASLTGGGAVIAPADPMQWENCLRDAIADPVALSQLAEKAVSALSAHHSPATQRRFWSHLLGFEAV